MSMSKSNSKEKTLGPLFLNKGDGGLRTFEFEIRSGSYLREGGPIVHKRATICLGICGNNTWHTLCSICKNCIRL